MHFPFVCDRTLRTEKRGGETTGTEREMRKNGLSRGVYIKPVHPKAVLVFCFIAVVIVASSICSLFPITEKRYSVYSWGNSIKRSKNNLSGAFL